jgi:hypothetical protein
MKKALSMNPVRLLLVAGALIVACSSTQNSSRAPNADRTFMFAPRVDMKFRHEMKNLDEVAVAGSNYRDSVESRVLWEVTVTQEGDTKYFYHRRLLELGLKVNGADVLVGPEIASQRAEVVQMMSRDGHVIDITGTEQVTQALKTVVPPAERARVAEVFSPENLRTMLMTRAVDAFDEVVGKPTDHGSTWSSKMGNGPLRGKQVLVDSSVGCGPKTCRKLKRTFDVDPEKVGDFARRRVAAFLASSGLEPGSMRVVEAKLKVEDTFVVEPDTCHFHDANLAQEGKVVLEGPKGNRMEVIFTNKQTSHAEYPPPA